MLRGALVIATCGLIAHANIGCVSGECGEGTVRYGDRCVAIDPFDKTPPQVAIDPPLYTRQVGIVRLTASEPATIYYTIDGTPPTLESAHEPDQVIISNVPDDANLRYFAIDLAGNQSEEGSRVWIIDREGPAAPLDFAVALAASTRTVTWTPPPDPRFGGVIVARVEGPLVSPPLSGETYATGDVLSPGVTIVHAANATAGPGSFMETAPTEPGMVRYLAWAYDDLHNYGPPAGDYQLVPIPPQTGRLVINAGNGEVTATIQPSHISFVGSATLNGSTLTVNISVKNETTRALFAPKVLVTNGLGTWSNSDGVFATFPYRAYGGAIIPNTSNVATWTFTGASAATTITLDVDVRDGLVLTGTTRDTVTAGRILDFATGKLVTTLQAGPTGQGGGAQTMRGGITPDGRLVIGARTTATVSSFDLATGKRILGTTLRPQKAHVPQLVLDKSGSAAYVLVADGHPQSVNNNGGSLTQLVRLDTATLTERGRLARDVSRNRDIAISPDGKTLVIATGVTAKGVIVVDLPTFTIKTRILPGYRAQCVVFSPSGTELVVVGEQIAIYNLSDGMRTALFTTPGTNGKVLRAAFSSPEMLWIGRRNESATINITTAATQVFTTLQARMLDFFDGKIYTSIGTTISRVALDGVVETTLPGATNLDGHWLGRSPF